MVCPMESIPLCENDDVKQGGETLSIMLLASSVSQNNKSSNKHLTSFSLIICSLHLMTALCSMPILLIYVHISLCKLLKTSLHKAVLIIFLYPPDKHHHSHAVYWRGAGAASRKTKRLQKFYFTFQVVQWRNSQCRKAC